MLLVDAFSPLPVKKKREDRQKSPLSDIAWYSEEVHPFFFMIYVLQLKIGVRNSFLVPGTLGVIYVELLVQYIVVDHFRINDKWHSVQHVFCRLQEVSVVQGNYVVQLSVLCDIPPVVEALQAHQSVARNILLFHDKRFFLTPYHLTR